jgi:C_GCAxxG_C_C family probable redox protein
MDKTFAVQERDVMEKAGIYFNNGFHCAEAVASAVLEALGMPSAEATAHATAFGGGFGRTFAEACGALSGALIAIGHLHGRRAPGSEWQVPAQLGAAARQRFLEVYGTTHCATLRARFGEENQMSECSRLVEKTAGILIELLLRESRTVQVIR